MAERVPAIRLTDPQSRDSAPNLPQSPQNNVGMWDGDFKRPTEPASRKNGVSESGQPPLSQRETSPSKSVGGQSDHNGTRQVNGQLSQADESTARRGLLAPVDPLSQHIMDRTNTTHLLPSALRSESQGPTPSDTNIIPERSRSSSHERGTFAPPTRTDTGTKLAKGKEKGVSFLNRIIGNKKKDHSGSIPDDVSEVSDHRPEGADAQVFLQPIDSIEYNPSHAQPPAYIKVRARNRRRQDFDKLFLAQELRAGGQSPDVSSNGLATTRRRSSAAASQPNTIWAMEFSKDGKYLATAGQDKVVRVWAVIASPDTRHTEERRESGSTAGSAFQHAKLSAQVFHKKPIRDFKGHESTVLDLSWSKNNFLLSSSMDKTVRLWHVSRTECLCTFKHNDFVPSIAFHPKDDRFFLAGSLDCKLRLWSIPDKHVAYWCQASDMITAVAFTPDGKHAMAGCLSGVCFFYETEGLKYQTQVHVRSAHGKNAKGSKITGIQAVQQGPHSSAGDVKLLISSNDSRVRLYNFRDKGVEIKFKGCENSSSQIRASITDDLRYVCCGSEDNRAYIWPTQADMTDRRDKRPVEFFQAHDTVVTCVCMAPAKTRQVLGKSEDPIYDLCNPPPVTLMSRAERAESQSSSRPPSIYAANSTRLSTDRESILKEPKESAGQIARSTHNAGNIVITADYAGVIKVFRQDCAHSKRRPPDNSDAGSGFMRRVGSLSMHRSGSMKTKGSNRSLRSSGHDSLSSAQATGSERILSWRQGIGGTPGVRNASTSSNNVSIMTNGVGGRRSSSPRKSSGQLSLPSRDKENTPRSPATTTTESLPPPTPRSPLTTTTTTNTTTPRKDSSKNTSAPLQNQANNAGVSDTIDDNALRPTETNPLMMIGDQSNTFWNVQAQKQMVDKARLGWQESGGGGRAGTVPDVQRHGSFVSTLSIDRSERGSAVGGGRGEGGGSGGESDGDSEYEDAKD